MSASILPFNASKRRPPIGMGSYNTPTQRDLFFAAAVQGLLANGQAIADGDVVARANNIAEMMLDVSP